MNKIAQAYRNVHQLKSMPRRMAHVTVYCTGPGIKVSQKMPGHKTLTMFILIRKACGVATWVRGYTYTPPTHTHNHTHAHTRAHTRTVITVIFCILHGNISCKMNDDSYKTLRSPEDLFEIGAEDVKYENFRLHLV